MGTTAVALFYPQLPSRKTMWVEQLSKRRQKVRLPQHSFPNIVEYVLIQSTYFTVIRCGVRFRKTVTKRSSQEQLPDVVMKSICVEYDVS